MKQRRSNKPTSKWITISAIKSITRGDKPANKTVGNKKILQAVSSKCIESFARKSSTSRQRPRPLVMRVGLNNKRKPCWSPSSHTGMFSKRDTWITFTSASNTIFSSPTASNCRKWLSFSSCPVVAASFPNERASGWKKAQSLPKSARNTPQSSRKSSSVRISLQLSYKKLTEHHVIMWMLFN